MVREVFRSLVSIERGVMYVVFVYHGFLDLGLAVIKKEIIGLTKNEN